MSKLTKNQIVIILGLLAVGIFINLSISNIVTAYNFEYVNVTTKVNVTNAYPVIDRVTVDTNILLNAGSAKRVNCNITLHDWNGYGDIRKLNATFWDNNTVNLTSADDNSSHYYNDNCTFISSAGLYNATYNCNFSVWYYANNGSNWICNATAIDYYNFTATGQNISSIQPYLALNVTPLIDFGNLAVGETAANITSNITNFGNLPINISVNGYGVVPNDGLAMNCFIGNISVNSIKYATDPSGARTPLSSALANITGLTVPKRLTTMLWNTTYWDLTVPPNPFGMCNGTVVFTAQAAG